MENETIIDVEAADKQTSGTLVRISRKCGLTATAEQWQENPTLYVNDCMRCELFTPECLE